jgi:hypothetical protein
MSCKSPESKAVDEVMKQSNSPMLMGTRQSSNGIGGEQFCMQRFIKSKGSKANIVRASYGGPNKISAWSISNKAAFDDYNKLPSIEASFCTQLRTDLACTITPLSTGAVKHFSRMVDRLVQYLENSVFQNHLSSVVADFIKDDMEQWWLSQVKAYRLRDTDPGRPLNISGRFKRFCALHSANASELSSDENDKGMRKSFSNKSLASKKENAIKWSTCGCCGAQFMKDELPFTMTVQMVTDTTKHLQGRMKAGRFELISLGTSSSTRSTSQVGKSTPTERQ